MFPDLYSKIGVRKVINAAGTLTRLGGARMDTEVTAAMAEAARSFVDLEELLAKSGEHGARLLGVGAAYISAGAAAGLAISACACLAGSDPARIARLPDTLTASEPRMPNKIAEAQFFHIAEKEGLLSVTLSLNGDPIDPEVLDNFAFEVHQRFDGRGGEARTGDWRWR